MRRIVRRTTTVVTIQTWTATWAEEVPSAEPAPSELGPARLDAPAPELPPGEAGTGPATTPGGANP